MNLLKEAKFYQKTGGGQVCCRLCHHNCVIDPGHTGFCGVRTNREGVLYAESYGYISSYGLDPIEKKPLNRFYPGSMIFSIGNYGCNFRCAFCQNHSISMTVPYAPLKQYTPEQIVSLAEQLVPDGNIGIAYTYNEPLIGYEFMSDCAILARDKGLKNVLVTNGCIASGAFNALLPYIDALNIDLKAYTGAFYRRIKGDLDKVKVNIPSAAAQAHLEVTTLIIPGLNDSETEIDALSRFIADIRPDIPLHLSRFFPQHEMLDASPTPSETIYRLKSIAERHLHYVYAGNINR